MVKRVRAFSTRPPVLALVFLLVLGGLLSLFLQKRAQASTYTSPFWSNNAPVPDSPIGPVNDLGIYSIHAVPCDGDGPIADVAVNTTTGELMVNVPLWSSPGVGGDDNTGLTLRSMVSGATQYGCGPALASWETTAQSLNGGALVNIRHANGRIDQFAKNGAVYVAPPGVYDTLTVVGNVFQLTDKWGNALTFDSRGMPATYVDRNGNETTYSYNASYQVTSITNERGATATFTSNASGHITSASDPDGDTYTFTYDANGHLSQIRYPGTQDQPDGIFLDLGYDGSGRVIDIDDGEDEDDGGGGGGGGGGAPPPPAHYDIAYDGATKRVASVTVGDCTTSFSYAPGVTTVTDARGNVHRYYFTGNKVTKTDMLVGGAAKYVTIYGYAGEHISKVVYPRGNRVDFAWDANGNLQVRRHRQQDTDVNDPSDLVYQWTYTTNNFVASYQDPRGNGWTYPRDAMGNLTQVTHPNVAQPVAQAASRSYEYNARGQRTKSIDEEGNETTYSYYAAGAGKYLLERVTVDPGGLALVTTVTYDNSGNIATVTDPNGKTFSLTWDALRRLVQWQAPAPLNYKVKLLYDSRAFLVHRDVENVDRDGQPVAANPWIRTSYAWSDRYNLTSLTEEIDATTTRVTQFDYDCNDNRIRVTKPEGNKDKWEFDERDRVSAYVRGEGDAQASAVNYEYDENDNLTKETDGRNKETTLAYDLFDRLVKKTNALGHYAEWELDKNGNVTKALRKKSGGDVLQRETYSHDERNRHWRTSSLFKDPTQTYADAVALYERTKTNKLKKLTDPRNNVTTYEYDAASRFKKIIDATGNEWVWTLDGNGNPTSWSIRETDGAVTVTHDYEATYDELNRRATYVEIDRNNGANRYTTSYSYDSRSNLVFLVNAEGNPTRWTLDGLNRMVKRERALTLGATIDDFLTAQVTQWGFDKNSRMTSHTDDGTNQTSWAYDALDRVTTMTYPDTKTVSYVYDANDNVTKVTDPAGNIIDDTFDDLNRNTSRTMTLATGFLGTTSESRTYDAVNRITVNRDNDYKLAYEYAEIGLTSHAYSEEQSYWGGTAYAKAVVKTYDAAGNRISETYPSGANLALNYVHDAINQLLSITDGTNTIAGYSSIGVRKKRITYGNTATRTNYYTGFRQEIESVRHETNAQATIIRLDYGYNKVHDRIYERFGASGASGDAFEYDRLRRLTKAWMGSANPSSPAGNPYTKTIEYNYDDDGNRTSVVVTPYQQAAQTTNYTTNNLYEYTAIGGTTHVWDANGNLTDNGTFKFKYNYKNLIVEVRLKSDNSLVAEYKYDAFGRRVEKDVGGTVERFILCGATNDVADGSLFNVMSVYDGNDNWLQNFVHGDDADEIVCLEQKDVLDYDNDGNTTEITRSYYHRNALGSVMEITDANQAVAVTYRYDPYGKVTITRNGQTQTSDPLGQHWVFTGRYLDEESGLYYYRARYYDPRSGRFLQRDPLGFAEGPSLYAYVDSNPANHDDPTGLGPGSVVAKKVLIKAAKKKIKDWVNKHIKSKLASLTKKQAKQIGKELDDILALLTNDTWADFLLDLIPGWGDYRCTKRVGEMLKKVRAKLQALLKKLKRAQKVKKTTDKKIGAVLKGAKKGRRTKGKAKQFDKAGDAKSAKSDFDSLGGSPPVAKGDALVKELPDGRQAALYPKGGDGAKVTLEIQDGKNSLKVRYK